VESFELKMGRGGDVALREAASFFMRTDPVHQALRAIVARFNELNIPYAIAGGMALVAHGYDRTTVDVDILVSDVGLQQIHSQLEGLGYLPPFKGSKQLRDVETGVRIEFLVTGQFPGDGKPKAIAFPDPTQARVEINGISYLRLEKLIELKLASGMTNPARLKDLADVQELIRILKLDVNFAQKLDPYVQGKFTELQLAVENNPEPSE
jgi:hypothetical protein